MMKYPEDFKGWKETGTVREGRYRIIESPDGNFEACIHICDNDVVGVMEKSRGIAIQGDDLEKALNLPKAVKEILNKTFF